MKLTIAIVIATATLMSARAQAADVTTLTVNPAENLYAAVPEPSQGALLLAGMTSLLLRRRRR